MNHLITILAMAIMAFCPIQSYARSSGAVAGAASGAAAGAAVSAGIAASAANTAAASSNNSQYTVQHAEGAAYDSMLYFKGRASYKDKNGLIVGLCKSSLWDGYINCKTFQQLADESGCEMKTFVFMPYRDEFVIYCRSIQK